MTSIEDRLLVDAELTYAPAERADWANVVQRTDRRVRRQRTTMRAALFGFLAVMGIALFLSGTAGVETTDSPLDLSPPNDSEVSNVPSMLPTYIAVLLTWGASLAVGLTVFFASPRDFRFPYFNQRVARLIATMGWVSLWNFSVAGVSGIALTAMNSSFLSQIHSSSGSLLVTVAIIVALAVFGTQGGRASGFLFVAVAMASGLARNALAGTADGTTALLAVHILVAGLITAVPMYTYRQLGFSVAGSRFGLDTLRSLRWRQVLAATLIAGGLLGSVISVIPGIVLNSQLPGPLPPVDGFDSTVFNSDYSPFFSGPPEVGFTYIPDSNTPLVGEMTEDEVQTINDENWIPVLEVLVPDEDPTGLVPGPPPDFESASVPFELWDDQTSTPLVLNTGNSDFANVTIGPLDPEPFERNNRLRNLGISLALIGMLLLWSETGVSRFTIGPSPWARHSSMRETIGWLVFWLGAVAVGLLSVIPILLSTRPMNLFALFIVLSLFVSFAGMKMVTPSAPRL